MGQPRHHLLAHGLGLGLKQQRRDAGRHLDGIEAGGVLENVENAAQVVEIAGGRDRRWGQIGLEAQAALYGCSQGLHRGLPEAIEAVDQLRDDAIAQKQASV